MVNKKVEDDVTRLIAMLSPRVSEDSDEFKFVRDALTRMAVLGTLPPGCRTKTEQLASID
jgi:hypothetical protein